MKLQKLGCRTKALIPMLCVECGREFLAKTHKRMYCDDPVCCSARNRRNVENARIRKSLAATPCPAPKA